MGHGTNQRSQIVMTQEEIDELLSGRHSMTICTLRPDGSVHAVAMWYGFLEGCIALESKAKAQKVVNLRRDPRITVLVEDGEYYDELRGVSIEGTAEIVIPAGTQHGQSFRLQGRGMPDVRGGRRGDQYVVIQLVIPKDLDPEQKALLRKVGGLTGKPEKVAKGFFDKLRDAISLD